MSLDISGHGFGNLGAAILGKALQVNCALKRLWVDENSVSLAGLQMLAQSLERNDCLNFMPVPILDVRCVDSLYFDLLIVYLTVSISQRCPEERSGRPGSVQGRARHRACSVCQPGGAPAGGAAARCAGACIYGPLQAISL